MPKGPIRGRSPRENDSREGENVGNDEKTALARRNAELEGELARRDDAADARRSYLPTPQLASPPNKLARLLAEGIGSEPPSPKEAVEPLYELVERLQLDEQAGLVVRERLQGVQDVIETYERIAHDWRVIYDKQADEFKVASKATASARRAADDRSYRMSRELKAANEEVGSIAQLLGIPFDPLVGYDNGVVAPELSVALAVSKKLRDLGDETANAKARVVRLERELADARAEASGAKARAGELEDQLHEKREAGH